MNAAPLVDLAPAARLALLALVIALLPLSWWWLRQRGKDAAARIAALTALTLFLTFDLVVFGAYTRLSDSGLGCPDWPGCYGQASPLGAHAEIRAADAAQPGGPVTVGKAWIEMLHRYLAMVVGVLIVALAAANWSAQRQHRLPYSRAWPAAALGWVIVQGLFGKYTVTLKLYPLVVTLHLLGGMVLLVLLAVQLARWRQPEPIVPRGLKAHAGVAAAALAVQIALGGWVSTHYAVLACSGFPRCNGQWWPDMDAGTGFSLLHALGEGGWSLPSLVAIHMAHRVFAVVATVALSALAWRLWRHGSPAARRWGRILALLLAAQWASGLSNVVLGWPLAAALGHSAGAAALVVVMTRLLAAGPRRRPQVLPRSAPMPAFRA